MSHPAEDKQEEAEEQLLRLRQLCAALPDTWEKLSHGTPTFFAGTRVFAMFDQNHHKAGRLGVWMAALMEDQQILLASDAAKYYRPPYVGCKGWIGVELGEVDDELLEYHLREAWQLISAKQKTPSKQGNAQKQVGRRPLR